MSTRRFSTTALAVVLALTFATAPAMANPSETGMAVVTETVAGKVIAAIMVTGTLVTMVISTITVRITLGKSDKSFKNSKDVGNDVDARVSFDHARHLALNYGLTGYDSLPPGIAKNPARGKPLPPGIAKKNRASRYAGSASFLSGL